MTIEKSQQFSREKQQAAKELFFLKKEIKENVKAVDERRVNRVIDNLSTFLNGYPDSGGTKVHPADPFDTEEQTHMKKRIGRGLKVQRTKDGKEFTVTVSFNAEDQAVFRAVPR